MGRRRRCRPINVVALAAVACAGSLGEAGVDAGGSVGLGTRQAGVSGCFVCTVSPVARPDRQLRRRRGLSSGSALRWDALSSRTRAATAFIDAEPQRTARAAAAAGSSSATRAFGTGGTQYGSRHLVCRLGGGGSGSSGAGGAGGGGGSGGPRGKGAGFGASLAGRAWRRISGGATAAQSVHTASMPELPELETAPALPSLDDDDGADGMAAAATARNASRLSVAAAAAEGWSQTQLAGPRRAPLPDRTASWWSRLTFGWAEPLLRTGNERVLQDSDVWELRDDQRMRRLADAFEAAYAEDYGSESGDVSGGGGGSFGGGESGTAAAQAAAARRLPAVLRTPLVRVIWRLHKRQFVVTGLLRMGNSCVQFLPALLLSRLLKTFEQMAATGGVAGAAEAAALARTAYGVALALFAVVTSKTLIENQYFYRMVNLGMAVRGAVATAVYRKSLRLSPAARQRATVGEIVNYMQLDSGRVEQMAMSIHTLWDSVFQVMGYTALLLWVLGPSVLAGVALMAALVPVNTLFFARLSKYRAAMLAATDRRIKTVQEMLQGIRAIKLYNWETPFRERVQSIHDEELDTLLRSMGLRATLVSVLSMTPAIVIVVTLGLYGSLGNVLTASKVFTALSLFNQLRYPLYFFPVTLSSLVEGKVSVDRLTNFLGAEELVPYVRRTSASPGADGATVSDAAAGGGKADVAISVKGGVFYWSDPVAEAPAAAVVVEEAAPEPVLAVATSAEAADEALQERLLAAEAAAPEGEAMRAFVPSSASTTASAAPVPTAVAVAGGSGGGTGAMAAAAASAKVMAGGGLRPALVRNTVPPALHGIDLQVKRGSLVAVVGGVGSGKSSLLAALLGELHLLSGAVSMAAGGVAYVPQTAWIPNDSLRNNICFGRPYDEERYEEVVRVCRLERDLELLEFGDETEIGEQGINLSGGQKQRLSLARALFSEAEIYLLDDPLSALDAEVGKAVFDECIKGALAAKTRVLVTNQLQFLPQVDHIVVMGKLPGVEGATIVDQGSYRELVTRGQDLSTIVERRRIGAADRHHLDDDTGDTDGEAVGGGATTEEEVAAAKAAGDEAIAELKRLSLLADVGTVAVPPAGTAAAKEKGRAGTAGADTAAGPALNEEAMGRGRLVTDGCAIVEANGNDAPEAAAGVTTHRTDAATHETAAGGVGVSAGHAAKQSKKQGAEMLRPGHEKPRLMGPAAAMAPTAVVAELRGNGSESFEAARGAADVACFVCPPPEYTTDGRDAAPADDLRPLPPLTAALAETAGDGADSAAIKKPKDSTAATAGAASTGGALMTAEERATGAVGWPVYEAYLRAAGGVAMLVALAALFVLGNAAAQGQQWVVSFWTSDPTYARRPLAVYLAGVTAGAAVLAAATHIRTLFAYWLGVRASRRLHGELLGRVLHAPTSYFDTTPVGRLVQRFSKDTDQIDQQLVSQMSMMTNGAMGMVAAVAAIVAATPPFALAVTPVGAVYLRIMNRFRPVARELKRLDSITRSPVYAHFGETLGGLALVRAFGHVQRFARANERLADVNFAVYSALKVADRWLSVHLEMLGNGVVLGAALLCVFATSRGRLSAGLAGLALTNALSVTGLLSWAVRCYAETETMMNSVERILYVARKTPQEAAHHVRRPRHPYYQRLDQVVEVGLPGATEAGAVAGGLVACPDDDLLLRTGWPWEGSITFEGVTMRYRPDTDPVLRGVDLNIRPGEKIGIVGRTGSGKSSLLQVLFRMVEVESGSVRIDGVDTRGVGLSALRSRLTIIPQEPALFSGDLRGNLDPFHAYSDQEIWEALSRASLAPVVAALPGGLAFPVAEYGSNLSAGQRQLVCLARALLRRTRVLLLDEATASVDYGTDAAIRAAIRGAFGDCTVLTIAHRLPTIMDSDRILVMDGGRAVELDTPAALMARPDSHFARLLRAERESAGGGDVEDGDAANGAVGIDGAKDGIDSASDGNTGGSAISGSLNGAAHADRGGGGIGGYAGGSAAYLEGLGKRGGASGEPANESSGMAASAGHGGAPAGAAAVGGKSHAVVTARAAAGAAEAAATAQ